MGIFPTKSPDAYYKGSEVAPADLGRRDRAHNAVAVTIEQGRDRQTNKKCKMHLGVDHAGSVVIGIVIVVIG